ncbi:hypothetical protein R0131_01195 [Clostridium sp. AL.422]|uniref:hypothetical protein n=1 Tax=Clostridium TaxID=1485 RepID=UPI00293DB749|nr:MULTISPECIES: hypothetical protein [unclassified Clostridium]MDV4149442.1 hypothetical protein [Clostridium sp. AL.422]
MGKFKVGDGVTVIDGPMKGIYGTVIYLNKKKEQYLIRFTANQQFYYYEDQIKLWESK